MNVKGTLIRSAGGFPGFSTEDLATLSERELVID